MDEIENAINESRNIEEVGEEARVPSAPRPSPEQPSVLEEKMQKGAGDEISRPSNAEKVSGPEERVQIVRFMVKETDPHTLPASFISNASDSMALSDPLKQ